MMRAIACLYSAALLSGLVFGQSGETKPAFEIADVHVSPPTRNPFLRRPTIRRGRYEIRLATMVDLIGAAWGIDAERVVGGPNWVENDRFDVFAKAPDGIASDAAKALAPVASGRTLQAGDPQRFPVGSGIWPESW